MITADNKEPVTASPKTLVYLGALVDTEIISTFMQAPYSYIHFIYMDIVPEGIDGPYSTFANARYQKFCNKNYLLWYIQRKLKVKNCQDDPKTNTATFIGEGYILTYIYNQNIDEMGLASIPRGDIYICGFHPSWLDLTSWKQGLDGRHWYQSCGSRRTPYELVHMISPYLKRRQNILSDKNQDLICFCKRRASIPVAQFIYSVKDILPVY